MSVLRTGPRTAAPATSGVLAPSLAAATVLAQIGYPLLHGTGRNVLTVATVLLFTAASVTHATRTRGPGFAVKLLLVSAGVGLVAEMVGVATGLPFGEYHYAGTLGPRVAGVPVIIPLAWSMMAYPAMLVGRVVAAGHPLARVAVAALALSSWDVFLDPQMTDAGHWRFAADNGPTLIGIPVVNFAGWLAVSVVLMVLLTVALAPWERPRVVDDRLPLGLYLWTYGSSVLANLAFFGRPDVALAGGLAMGVPVFLLVRALRRERDGSPGSAVRR